MTARRVVLLLAVPLLFVASVARAQGAEVYPQNPVRTPALEVRPLPIAVTGNRLENDTLTVRSCVDRGSVATFETLGGRALVRVCDLESLAASDAVGDFRAPPLDVPETTDATRDVPDPYAEISAYYHSARALSYFRQLSGRTLSLPKLTIIVSARAPAGLFEGDLARLTDTTLAMAPTPGSFFVSGGPASTLFGMNGSEPVVVLGQGYARDFAYDGDIVIHEIAHAIFDGSLSKAWHLRTEGTSIEGGALVEGIADYFAAACSGDPLIAEYASGEIPFGLGMRSLESNARCPESITGDPHADGRVVASLLWSTRKELTQDQRAGFDACVYRAVIARSGHAEPTSFSTVFTALRSALAAALPAALAPFDRALSMRGLHEDTHYACHVVRDLSPGQSLSGDGGPFIAPAVKGTPRTPGIVQLRVRPPSSAKTLHLRLLGTVIRPALLLDAPSSSRPAFTPVLLGRRARPIEWRVEDTRAEPDAELRADFVQDGAHWEATLALPDDTADIYLQIANAGSSDGWYDVLTLRFDDGADAGALFEDGGTSSRASGGSGCACATPSKARPSWLLLALCALLAGRSRRTTAPRRS